MVGDFFWRFLFSKRAGSIVRKISWLSSLALTVSIASLIVVMSVMKALNTNIRTRLLAVEPHLVIESTDNAKWPATEAEIQKRQVLAPDWKIFPFELQDVILRTPEGRFRGAVARGLTPESLDFIMGEVERVKAGAKKLDRKTEAAQTPMVSEGSVLSERSRLESGEVLMGIELAHTLGLFDGDGLTVVAPEGLLLPAGETPRFEKVVVKEILITNLQDFDAEGLFYLQGKTLPGFRDSASLRRGFEIWLPESTQAFGVQKELREKLADLPVKITTWEDRNSALFLSLKLEKLMIGLFLAIASLVAGFSLLTVLGLLISQKKREIGLLQAMGLSRRSVFLLFQGLGLRLTGMGLVGGGVIGLSLAIYMQIYPLRVLPDIYYDSEIPAEVDVLLVLSVFGVGFALSYLGGLLVTRPLAAYAPTELLRMKK